MSHLPAGAPDVAEAPSAAGITPRVSAPVLISEQQVLFGTAAALHGPVHRRRRVATLITALGRIRDKLLEPRAHCARREPAYFEAARMSREMDRL